MLGERAAERTLFQQHSRTICSFITNKQKKKIIVILSDVWICSFLHVWFLQDSVQIEVIPWLSQYLTPSLWCFELRYRDETALIWIERKVLFGAVFPRRSCLLWNMFSTSKQIRVCGLWGFLCITPTMLHIFSWSRSGVCEFEERRNNPLIVPWIIGSSLVVDTKTLFFLRVFCKIEHPKVSF